MLIDFREGGDRKGGRERERDIDWLPPVGALTSNRTCNLFGVWEGAPTN